MENVSGDTPAAEEVAAAPPHHPIELARAEATSSERTYLVIFGALVIGVAFWYLQFATQSICCGDFDAYYHFRWSRMLWDGILAGQFPPTFNALPLTTLNAKDYVDHHLLFHFFQFPFTLFGNFQYGAKLGTWLFACLAVYSCYWLLLRYRISYPLVWLVAILGSAAPFLYRIHMGKAMSISIVMLVVGIHLFFQRKYVWLLPLAFVFALTYDMVLLLLVAAFCWFLVVLWIERSSTRALKGGLLAVGLVTLGIALGYVINPYFPHNVQLTFQHLMMKVTPQDFSTAVGGEWYPYNTLEFLGNCGLALVAMIAGYIAFRDSTDKASERSLFFLLFATFLMVVNMRWRRFSEYWPPFAILFAAFSLQTLVDRVRANWTASTVSPKLDEAEPSAPRTVRPANDWRSWDEHEAATVGILLGAILYPIALLVAESTRGAQVDAGTAAMAKSFGKAVIVPVLGVLGVSIYLLVRGWGRAMVMASALVAFGVMGWYHHITVGDIGQMPGPDRYQAGMEWVSKNVPKGELVYNADWDDFPKLFFYDPERPFVAGLDPTYLLDKNKELMKHYERIGKGEEDNPGPIIREQFCLGQGEARRCARYVFMDHEHEAFFNNALDSGWFEVAYEDGDCSILRIRDEKGSPPPDNVPPGEQQDRKDDAPQPADDEDGPEEEEPAGP